ncbi:MAG: cbb3-type cytochrome c oxidase subunit I [Planctomycetota bacterium]
MTSIPNPGPSGITDIFGKPVSEKAASENYLTHGKGIWSWLLTLDHKRIGIMYMIAVLAYFLVGGLFAIILRTMLLSPDLPEVSPLTEAATNNFYNQSFTLHGAVMVFLFIIPAIPAILGNFVLPLMLGAKDVAFPRLNLFSWYCYMGGSMFFLWVLGKGILNLALLNMFGIDMVPVWGHGGLDTGWTFYTPYSTGEDTGGAVVAATAGAFILGFSSILTGLNFIASIHMLRPPGMGWFKLPLLLWGLYATSIIQILATPVLAITLLLLISERLLRIGIFDPTLGGDPVLYQHFFWFYSHPAVYIMILPAFGVISEVISNHSRKHIFGYGFIACSSMAIALLGFLVWGHHMFTSGQSALLGAIFSFITMFIAVPSAIKVFNWLATMYQGSIRLSTPMIYAMGFIWLFTIGGLTGLFLASMSTDIYLHDTYFVVAHFHYVMVGSTLFAFLAGMHHWWPKMFGKNYSEVGGQTAAWLIFIGFNVTFIVQFIAGAQGMPRRYATYPEEYHIWHVLSTLGSYVLTVGLFAALGVWIHSLYRGTRAVANPWGGNSLEWHTTSPPPFENFKGEPVGTDPYDYTHWHYDEKLDGYVLVEEEDPYEAERTAPDRTPAPAQPV